MMRATTTTVLIVLVVVPVSICRIAAQRRRDLARSQPLASPRFSVSFCQIAFTLLA